MVSNKIYWHRFNPASQYNIRQLGAMPQVTHDQGWNIFTQGADFKGLIFNFFSGGKFPEEFIVPKLVAAKKARVSDFLQLGSLSLGTFIASERTKQLIDGFRLPPHQFYKTKACFGDKEFNYYIYHFYDSDLDMVDFDKTKFCKVFTINYNGDKEKFKNSLFTFSDKEQLLVKIDACLKEEVVIKAKPLVLKQKPFEYDLFYVRSIYIGFFITDELKNELIKSKINGWAINSEFEYFQYGIHKYKTY